jgi:SAM-dependent methyltransferase
MEKHFITVEGAAVLLASSGDISEGNASDRKASTSPTDRVYTNAGNKPLINLLDSGFHRVLDIGCGAGDNAILIKSRVPDCDIFGITHSASEAEQAEMYMKKCWVIDIEGGLPDDLLSQSFDVLIFSHVLEHLRNPATVLARFSHLLRKGGQVLIAIPNILSFRMRVQFLRGDFRYQSSGPLDDTHLRFYTYLTADQCLLAEASDLKLTHKTVSGSVPLWVLRRHIFPTAWSKQIDAWGERHWPNLFGGQVLIRAVKE